MITFFLIILKFSFHLIRKDFPSTDLFMCNNIWQDARWPAGYFPPQPVLATTSFWDARVANALWKWKVCKESLTLFDSPHHILKGNTQLKNTLSTQLFGCRTVQIDTSTHVKFLKCNSNAKNSLKLSLNRWKFNSRNTRFRDLAISFVFEYFDPPDPRNLSNIALNFHEK